jgi:hypothetical protein
MLTERVFGHYDTDLRDILHKTTALCQAHAIEQNMRVYHIHIDPLRPSQAISSTIPTKSGCV